MPAVWQHTRGVLLLYALCLGGVPQAKSEDTDFFETKIRPLLADKCYECHSAEKKIKGGLTLDTKEATLKGGETGPALIAGDPAKSLLMEAVRQAGDLKMPPKSKLTAQQISDLEEWIKMGAPDPRAGKKELSKIEQHFEAAKQHWAFQAVPPLKEATLDALLGTRTGPAADKRTLIRRAYLDLIGMPPSFDEVKAFVADASPQAYEKLLDKLLADPRYGERWGRHWLDVARYADNMGSLGGGDDPYPFSHTYRDYVIKAFNADKPYDRFLLEQLAADQLETKKDPETLAGMGFLGVGTRKDRRIDADFMDDIIDVVGRGLLGISIGCARCHDHKLEPVTTKDYYGLYYTLVSSKEPEIAPIIPQPDSPDSRDYADKNLKARQEYIRVHAFEADRSISGIRSRLGDYLEAAQDSQFKTSGEGKTVKSDILDPRRLNGGVHSRIVKGWDKWVKGHPEVFKPWLELAALNAEDFAATAKNLCEGYAKNEDKKLLVSVARAFVKIAPRDMRDIVAVYNQLYAVQVEALWGEKWREPLLKACVPSEEELGLPLSAIEPRAIDRVTNVQRANPLPEADEQALRAVFMEDGSPFQFTGKDFLTYQVYGTRDVADGIRRNATKAVTALTTHPGAPMRAMVFEDLEKPTNGKVWVRGNSNTRGADAPRQFLSVLKNVAPDPFPKDKSGRLELARAIASRDNPLTSRVIVNRVWNWHFGSAIVGTPSDFGFRGDKPANQPLLDYLAAWFPENGWSFKKLHKLMMLTAAYQSADFAMRPLELEPFRDSVLAVSGRLKSQLYGKPEKVEDTLRRTLYAYVDRRTPPSLYRSFDFPSASFSAPQRSRTALPPRALILLNSPLLTESAKTLAESLQKAAPDEPGQILELYRRVLQRDPTEKETQWARAFLKAYPQNVEVHPESRQWQYGSGRFDSSAQTVADFSPLTSFDGKGWSGTAKMPDGTTSKVLLTAMGGDSGTGDGISSVRRWTAPVDGEIQIQAEITRSDAKADELVARVISNRAGLLGEWTVQGQSVCTEMNKLSVKKGDVLDFVVTSKSGKTAGAYQWSPSILMPGMENPSMPGMAQRWDARVDFSDPNKPPKPLAPLEELTQAILLSPEFSVLE